MASSNSDYTEITAVVTGVNDKAVIVEGPDGDDVVIGRSCVFGPDDKELDDAPYGERHTFRVMSWLARKENLA